MTWFSLGNLESNYEAKQKDLVQRRGKVVSRIMHEEPDKMKLLSTIKEVKER
ncbi:unnamed protein product [Sphenostylis stenocarpa]|uniref:Uncharacterized protein n=1 Tax=Sphenostylis stenocarpa TaxID=92480 RepID=A0AA86S7N9_9FABA|nr:unnamed protein product [Sphenostylis stenocarpa]